MEVPWVYHLHLINDLIKIYSQATKLKGMAGIEVHFINGEIQKRKASYCK